MRTPPVFFGTITTGAAHGDSHSTITPVSSIFRISCFSCSLRCGDIRYGGKAIGRCSPVSIRCVANGVVEVGSSNTSAFLYNSASNSVFCSVVRLQSGFCCSLNSNRFKEKYFQQQISRSLLEVSSLS